MKKLLLFIFLLTGIIPAQSQTCLTGQHFRTLGSAANVLTFYEPRMTQLSYDTATNSLTFIHRANPAVSGGSSGDYRYDFSSDGGTTWTNNIGVLNPTNATNGLGRYPQALNYHPVGAGTAATNNYIVYYGPTLSGTTWNGYVSGTRKLNGTGNTENYNQAGVTSNVVIPGGLCQGTSNTFWTVDGITNSNNVVASFKVLKGTYSAGAVTWSLNANLTPTVNTALNGNPYIVDWNIAFDPTGQYGWIVFLGHMSGAEYTFRPIFYKTTNGGVSWSGPIEVTLGQFAGINALLQPGTFPTTAFDIDIAVDKFGNPHTLVLTGSGSGADYSIYTGYQMAYYDINFNGTSWVADYIYDSYTLRGTLGNAGGGFYYDNSPQISRSADGNLLAYVWADTYAGLSGVNSSPDLYGRFHSVSNNAWDNNLYEYSYCTAEAGKIILPKVSPTLVKKANGIYQIPVVYMRLNPSGSENDPVTFIYLDDLNYNSCTLLPPAPVITASGSTTICTGGNVTLSTTQSYSTYLWSTGATTSSINVTTAGNFTVTVTASGGCSGTSAAFTTTQGAPPVISSFTPVSGSSGTAVTINGSNFSSASAVSFNGTTAGFTVNSNTQISTTVPVGATTGKIAVTNGCGVTQSTGNFTIPPASATLNLHLFLEGLYLGGNLLQSALGGSNADYVTVELHAVTSPYATVWINASPINTTGSGSFTFPAGAIGNSYYIVVKHRNSIETWSKTPVTMSASTSFNFAQ
ncbi:MAG: hypothetical protein U0Y08_10090 [Bacteroidia bacterium]